MSKECMLNVGHTEINKHSEPEKNEGGWHCDAVNRTDLTHVA